MCSTSDYFYKTRNRNCHFNRKRYLISKGSVSCVFRLLLYFRCSWERRWSPACWNTEIAERIRPVARKEKCVWGKHYLILNGLPYLWTINLVIQYYDIGHIYLNFRSTLIQCIKLLFVPVPVIRSNFY